MMDNLISILKEEAAISSFEILKTHTQSVQLFYVLNKLETNRYTDNDDLSVTIYVEHDDKLGSSTLVLNAADDLSSIKKKIKEAIDTAQKVDNEPFELEKDVDSSTKKVKSIDNRDLSDIALKAADAIIKADHFENGWLNSIEVFAQKKQVELLNSYGVKRSFEKTTLEAEVIPTFKGEIEEIELYLHFEMMDEDYAKITQRVEQVLKEAYYRSIAQKCDSLDVDVLLSGEMRDLIFSSLAGDLNFASKYMKMNHYELNDELVPYDLNLSVVGCLDGASHSAPFDAHGSLIKDTTIVANGKVVQNWGDIRFGQYLKASHISGNANLVKVDCASSDKALAFPYLEIVNFSSPQLEENSGYCGGEVRLGLLHKSQDEIIPLTSFSISCNIYEAIKDALYSKEQETDECYCGPKYLRLKNVKIA